MKHTAQQISFQTALQPGQQYTNATTISNKVYVRARQNDGSPVYVEQKYSPVYYVPTVAQHATHWGYEGQPLAAHLCPSIYEGRDWVEKSKLPVYGNIQPEYMALSDTYGAHEVVWDLDRLYVWDIDIEVDSEHGFAKPENAFAEITAITVLWRHMGKMGTVVYGRKDYTPKGDELYIKCDTEDELLIRFLEDLRSAGDYPDIITGWNVQFYDIPYLVKRLQQRFTEATWARISPFERLSDRTVIILGRSQTVIDIKGVAILDYQELYRKFTYTQQESYRLDHIAHIELKKRKVPFKEYKTLRRLYAENHQLFIEYNIRDVNLVDELDQKLKLIELVCALAYGAKSNFVDCFKQVRLWDIMIYHKLRADGKQIPPRKDAANKSDQYAGAFVKDPIPGFYKWVCSFDVASMYPHIIREWNLSPETKLKMMVPGLTTRGKMPDEVTGIVDSLLAKRVDTSAVHQQDYCLASNGVLTQRDKEGFIPAMLKTLYDERVKFKNLQKQAKKDLEKETDPAKQKELTKKISAYGNQQSVRKVNLNSAYGAIGSAYFRFFDVDLAEAVTVTGQMVIRWIAKDINTYLNKAFKTNIDYIIASDTDSVYINMERVAALVGTTEKEKVVNALDKFCKDKIQPLIDKAFVEIAEYLNVTIPCLSMIRDVIADNGIWTAKKHYVLNVYDSEGVRYEKPKLLVHGLEMVKSSTPAIVRDWMKKALELLVADGAQKDMWAYVAKCERDFMAAPFEDIASPRSVNLKKYKAGEKGLPINVAAALTFNDTLERKGQLGEYEPIRDGEKIKYAYLRTPNPFFSHVMGASHGCPPEWEVEKWLDYDLQLQKTFINPLEDILKCAGWTTKEQPDLFAD